MYTLHTATLKEVELAVEWAAREGWNPGLSDARAFYAQDPSGFFVGKLHGEPVSCISCVRYPHDFAFIGFYMVSPEYRGMAWRSGTTPCNTAMGALWGWTESPPSRRTTQNPAFIWPTAMSATSISGGAKGRAFPRFPRALSLRRNCPLKNLRPLMPFTLEESAGSFWAPGLL